MNDYSRWENIDVNKAEEEAEQVYAQAETIRKQDQFQKFSLTAIEKEIEALTVGATTTNITNREGDDTPSSQYLQEQSNLLQACLNHRRDGKIALDSNDFSAALEQFSLALERLKKYNDILKSLYPERFDDKENLTPNESYQNPSPQCPCHPNKNKTSNNNEKKPTTTTPTLLLNKTTPLQHHLQTLLATAQLRLRSYSSCAATLSRCVLPHDRENTDAWVLRGQAFEGMGVPLLARRHYLEALSITNRRGSSWTGKELRRRAQDMWRRYCETKKNGAVGAGNRGMTGVVSGNDDDDDEGAKICDMSRRCFRDLLCYCLECHHQAVVLFHEGCYSSSGDKYRSAVRCMEEMERVCFWSPMVPSLPEAFREFRIMCHLGCASCHLRRRRNFGMVVSQCDAALDCLMREGVIKEEIDDGRGKCWRSIRLAILAHRADARERLGEWDGVIEDLEACQLLCDDDQNKVIASRMEKVRFLQKVTGNPVVATGSPRGGVNLK